MTDKKEAAAQAAQENIAKRQDEADETPITHPTQRWLDRLKEARAPSYETRQDR